MKVLLVHPDFGSLGGVARLFRNLDGRFTIEVEHLVIGTRPNERSRGSMMFRLLSDYVRFLRRSGQVQVVHVNPSLDPKSCLRDGLFVLLSRLTRKKVVVFFHGWNKPFEARLGRRGLGLFRFAFGKADAFIVLADEFKNVLRSWGFDQPIHREMTIVGDDVLERFDFESALERKLRPGRHDILFLSRIVREKGVLETVDAVALLHERYPDLHLIVAGDGPYLEELKLQVEQRGVKNVTFTGYVDGDQKEQLLRDSHLLCFPTYYGEGLPTVVPEAISFGLPVVTRPVGGIADFFENGRHGFAIESRKPEDIAHCIQKLIEDKELYRRIARSNHSYGQKYFLASQAAARLERIYASVLRTTARRDGEASRAAVLGEKEAS